MTPLQREILEQLAEGTPGMPTHHADLRPKAADWRILRALASLQKAGLVDGDWPYYQPTKAGRVAAAGGDGGDQ